MERTEGQRIGRERGKRVERGGGRGLERERRDKTCVTYPLCQHNDALLKNFCMLPVLTLRGIKININIVNTPSHPQIAATVKQYLSTPQVCEKYISILILLYISFLIKFIVLKEENLEKDFEKSGDEAKEEQGSAEGKSIINL